MSPSIEIQGVTKRYGTKAAVDDLSFTVAAGKVTGLVGPNGAGKTTLLRVVLGLTIPDRGRALIAGRPYAQLRAPLRHVGALLDAGATHPGRRARDHLRWMAASNGLPERRVDDVFGQVGLADVARQKTGSYSLGMAQRLGIAAALLGDPQMVLLDEPINGLDPDGVRWIRSLLRSLAAEGRVVLVSSHVMAELEDTADHVVIVGRGRLVGDASVRDLVDAASDHTVILRTPDRSDAMKLLANAGATVTSTGGDSLAVAGLDPEHVAELVSRRGLRITALAPQRATLEDAYLQLTRPAVEHAAQHPTGVDR